MIRQSDLNENIGKVPPSAINFEEFVLGSVLLEKNALYEIIDILNFEMFYLEKHRIIYQNITRLFNENKPIDIITVTEEIRQNKQLDEIGGAYYITKLTVNVGTSSNIEYHARIIQQKYMQRELIRISQETLNNSYSEFADALELVGTLENEFIRINQNITSKKILNYKDVYIEVINEIREIQQHPDKLTGVPSGFTEIDRHTGGWQQSDLIIIAARPAMGKTSFALNCAINCSKLNNSVAFFSLEMSAKQLIRKIIASENNINLSDINSGNITEYEWGRINANYSNIKNLFIDDSNPLSTLELRAKAIRLKRLHDIKLIIIDYLQLMTPSGLSGKDNREREISKISSSLKSLAKELEIPIIALSQLSRDVEKRGGNKKPMLSDLRESGAIEQDADIVIFPFRPSYYNIDNYEHKNINYNSKDLAVINFAKGRNIETGEHLLNFKAHYSKFTDYEAETTIEDLTEKPLFF